MLATLTLTLAACGDRRSGAKLDASRQLPDAPACMNEIAPTRFTPGFDAKLAFATRSNELKLANQNLRCSKGWYAGVRKDYGGPR